MLIAADKDEILIISGTGDVIEPDNHIAAIGSGAMYAQSAALALKNMHLIFQRKRLSEKV